MSGAPNAATAAANAEAAAIATHRQAVDLIQQAAALLAAIPGRTPETQALQPAITLIEQAIPIVQGVREAGDSGLLRWRIYQLLQAQKNDGNSAIYKELRCAVCLDLAGLNGPPVTIGCGHTYCKGCITPIATGAVPGRKCPDCRTPIIAGSPLVTNVAIKAIVERLVPRPAGPGGKRGKRKTQKNRTR